MKLTTAKLDLPAGKSGCDHWDDTLIGFGLRLRRGGGGRIIRRWIVAYRAHGRQRRPGVSADSVSASAAREWARKILARVELGEDPQSEKEERRGKDTRTLKWVALQFIDHKTERAKRGEIKPRSVALIGHYLIGQRDGAKGNRRGKKGRHVESWLKGLHHIAIDKVTRGDIAACLVACEKHSGTASAIALRSAISSLFSHAQQMGFVEQNPTINAFKPEALKSRDRVLSSDELIAIWRNLEDNDYGKVIRLLILTGSRRSEIGGMRWSEIDLDKGVWTLPKERSKNKLAHVLPITPMMRSILESIPQRDGVRGGDVLFGFTGSGFTNWKYKQALDAKLDLPPWLHHDIRRGVASSLGDIGVQPHVIEEILNHRSGHRRGVAGIYNKSSYANEVRAALLMWQDHIKALLEGRAPKVVPFERAL
jgi:integrase